MHEEIAIGGFGGQGVLFIGRLLAEAAFQEGHEVVFMPSYGAEKRGGTVWCNVTISDEKIGALFITRPTVAIAMNATSLAKLEPAMKPGGLLVINQSLIPTKTTREDISAVYVPTGDLAAELGDSSAGNLVALGALLASRPVVPLSGVITVMDSMLTNHRERSEMNRRALNEGYHWTQRDRVSVHRVERKG
ncbi:MAG: 2-oxoacid:acceptor oxidoreductase family protein [Dehalococcoidales bacterium]